MLSSKSRGGLAPLLAVVILCSVFYGAARAQTEAPLASQDFVRLLYQLPAHPEKKDELVDEIRRRGIGFALTDGMRSLVATKSGNDALLRRTLEEAERRRVNPAAAALPVTEEASELLENARTAALAASEAMPDFIVKQLITRAYARGRFINWTVQDHLTLAVSYRASAGEEYKVLSINGQPPANETKESGSYAQIGGSSSSGEYVSGLAALFKPETRAVFKVVDTDTLRNRRTVVYEYSVKQENSKLSLSTSGHSPVITAYRGRVWVDRENYRVLRFETIAVEIPFDFPMTAGGSTIDYDWVTINEQRYLLPSAAEIRMTVGRNEQAVHTRNEIRFRGYQKFGAEVKILDDVGPDDEPETKPETKPESKPPQK
ncbi:MAG: hypothetical protein QOF02_2394 [Blastocatellia bacterium]|jgi:hypothetical protein|nr:hypothetical protein [Blastocatellia bacterium]